jgi:hypothetical protein
MRLLRIEGSQPVLEEFFGDEIPPYAILSHTWGATHEEVSCGDITGSTQVEYTRKIGYKKLLFCIEQAAKDGIQYSWVDTCCIDKTSSAELSEAINSMFAWYRNAKVCYAYLADVECEKADTLDATRWLASRWWSRAWTLQEYLAPHNVVFYNATWVRIGDKTDKAAEIQATTGIDEETSKDSRLMYSRSVAQRMSWAANRYATRTEDIAYSLLGIFEINMPLLYGEGRRAFLRLQQEILRTVNDQSLFAWGFTPKTIWQLTYDSLPASEYGLFADMPSRFADCGKVLSYHRHGHSSDIRVVNGALHLAMPLTEVTQHPNRLRQRQLSEGKLKIGFADSIALLPCAVSGMPEFLVGIMLTQMSATNQQYARKGLSNNSIFTFLVVPKYAVQTEIRSVWVGDRRFAGRDNVDMKTELRASILLTLTDQTNPPEYTFVGILPEVLKWHGDSTSILLPDNQDDWPVRATIALYNRAESELVVLNLRLDIRPGHAALQLGRCRTAKEKVQEELKKQYRARGTNFMKWYSQVGDASEGHTAQISVRKVFNHVVFLVDCTLDWEDTPMFGTKWSDGGSLHPNHPASSHSTLKAGSWPLQRK